MRKTWQPHPASDAQEPLFPLTLAACSIFAFPTRKASVVVVGFVPEFTLVRERMVWYVELGQPRLLERTDLIDGTVERLDGKSRGPKRTYRKVESLFSVQTPDGPMGCDS